MFERFTRDARAVVTEASRQASIERGDRHIGTEHLLMGVPAGHSRVAGAVGWTPTSIRLALAELEGMDLARIGVIADVGDLPRPIASGRFRHLPFTHGAKRSLERSLRTAADLGHRRIGADHILAALAQGDAQDTAVRIIRHLGALPAEIVDLARTRSAETE